MLTPKCKSLYNSSLLLKKKLVREISRSKTFRQRLKAAEKVSEQFLDSNVVGRLTPAAAIFTKLQFRETCNLARGRRFTMEEKLLSLSLYKQSMKSYRILSKLFTLPSRKTLSTLLSKIPITTGLDKTFLKVLSTNVQQLKERDRYCVIMFDEVSLHAELHYDSSSGLITGFEDNGISRTQNFADHSLVFMVKSITKKYKQPISYSFCKSTTNKYDLMNQIRNVIKAVTSTGLKVIATISDQGTSNSAAINLLKNDTKQFYLRKDPKFNYDERFYEVDCGADRIKIVHLYDPPHLLQGINIKYYYGLKFFNIFMEEINVFILYF